MKRRTLPTAVALAAAAGLLLTACGGGDDSSEANDKIAGADTGSTTAASPSTSASSGADRPRIAFPSYAKNVFENRKTGDATKDAVLADSAMSVDSMDDAIFKGSTGTKALGFYNADKALNAAITYVQGYIDKNDVWIGETRYFDRRVALSEDRQAYVTYCSDESRSFLKNTKTHNVDKAPTSADSYVLYHTSLTKNARGVWQTTNIVSNRGDKACQP